jgi:hypothetical protein
MAQFELLPTEIQKTVKTHLLTDEKIEMCFLAGSVFLEPEYVVITSKRIIVLDVRNIGSLSQCYVNVRCDVPFTNIIKIDTNRSFKNKLLGQANISIQINGYEHLINNISTREANRAVELLSSLIVSESKKSVFSEKTDFWRRHSESTK